MATTISAGVLSGGGRGIRASVNGHQFVDAEVMRGGGRMITTAVATSKEILIIDSWDPLNNADPVDHGHSVKLNLHAIDSEPKEILYDEGTEWNTEGTHDDTEAVGDVLQLATSAPSVDFEDYVVDANLDAGSQPGNWTKLDQVYSLNTKILDDIGGEDNQYIGCSVNNDNMSHRFDDAGSFLNGVVQCRFRGADVSDPKPCGAFFRTTGAGTAMRGHAVLIDAKSQYATMVRINDWDSTYGIASRNLGFTVDPETWYWIKVRFWGTTPNTYWEFKVWEDGDAEPGSYTWGAADTAYWGAGYVGIWAETSGGSETVMFDDFSVLPDPAVYVSSGEWVANPVDVTVVEHYSHALVSWDETLPTDTTAAVKFRWRDADTWSAASNGGELPGIERGDNMEAGSPYTDLQIKIELATTDTGETPEIENLRIYFEPVAEGGLEIDLDGDISCTVANEYLDYWGREQVVAAAVVQKWDDIWIQTEAPRWVVGLGHASEIKLMYGGDEVDSIIINWAEDWWLESAPLGGYYWGMTPLVYDGPPVDTRWNVSSPWFPGGHIYEWVLIDRGIAIHADAKWLCGHIQVNDQPGSLLAGELVLDDHPGSLLVQGYALDDFIGQLLVQGRRLDDQPGSVLPAVEFFIDSPGSVLVGTIEISNQPGSMLVYGVNRDGAIFVSVIDDNTYQTLIDHGITFS